MAPRETSPGAGRAVSRALSVIATAGMAALGAAAHAEDSSAGPITFRGFGTLAAAYSTERQADFVGSLIQPNGAGHTLNPSFAPDSKLGLQGQVDFGERLASVVQVVAQHQYDNGYAPRLEWANVKFKVRPDLSLRVGRIELPVFMLSDSRLVGFADTALRPPVELYSSEPLTSNDGVDLTWHVDFDDAVVTVQALIGHSRARFPDDLEVTANGTHGMNVALESGAVALRLHYTGTRVDLRSASIDSLLQGYQQLGALLLTQPGLQAAGTRAIALAQRYRPIGVAFSMLTLGVSYDPDRWVVTAEYGADMNSSVFFDRKAWYATIGRHFGDWTPYLTGAQIRGARRNQAGLPAAALPPPLASTVAALDAGLERFLGTLGPTQSSVSLGLRWDFARNFDLKLEYDRIRLGADSAGTLINLQPDFRPGGTLGVVAMGIDFVF